MIPRRIAAPLAVAGLLCALFAACDASQPGSPTIAAGVPSGLASPTDGDSDGVDGPPSLAPVPAGVKAGPKCEAAYKAWVDWWVVTTGPDSSADPSEDGVEVPSNLPPGDPNVLERTLFDTCTLAQLGAANATYLVTLEAGEPPAPYITDEIGYTVAGLCDTDDDVVAGTKLCKAVASPSP